MSKNMEKMSNSKDWNPHAYLQFRNERTQASIDLVNRIRIDFIPQNIIDIGCGPGNSSQVLMSRWPQAKLLGLDSSKSMIEKARTDFPQHDWVQADASSFQSETKFDIVFSNATIQWIPDHDNLLRKFISLLSDRGILAFQIPLFNDMPVSKVIQQIAIDNRWRSRVECCRDLFTFHNYSYYYNKLSMSFDSVELWETHYIHVLDSHSAIIDWIRSTGLKPYLDNLENDDERKLFENMVLNEIKMKYQLQENGKVLFPFKRLFAIARKN
jgi:trans-aconitate 2-methyltransferase